MTKKEFNINKAYLDLMSYVGYVINDKSLSEYSIKRGELLLKKYYKHPKID